MKTDIVLAGVGGQGILSIATVIGQAAFRQGLYIKQAEVHGMSQRGGYVQATLRLSDKPIASDLVSLGQADVIIAMEPMEALRNKEYLSEDGWIITSSNPLVNIRNYPDIDAILNELREVRNLVLIDTEKVGNENKMAKAVNMILLGAASRALACVSFDNLCDSVKTIFHSKGDAVIDMNIRALEIGRDCK